MNSLSIDPFYDTVTIWFLQLMVKNNYLQHVNSLKPIHVNSLKPITLTHTIKLTLILRQNI